MFTIVKKLDNNNIDYKVLDEVAITLKQGGLVAFPTETVYGLGANALSTKAASKIYIAKGRPSDNPLIIHISEYESVEKLATNVPDIAKVLANEFWPGPLTMILNKSKIVPYETTGGLSTVAIRMPKNDIALELIRRSGIYIAAPSANTSGKPSPTLATHVIDDLDGKVDIIIDGGRVPLGIESTIIDLTQNVPIILRPGFITKNMLENIIGKVDIAIETDRSNEAIMNNNNTIPRAPGMKYKHYAPKGELTIIEGARDKVCNKINVLTKEKLDKGNKVGIIATNETKHYYNTGVVKVIGSRKKEDSIANKLYELLREFDDLDIEYIYSESFWGDNLGQAIMNRLLKAAGYRIIEL